ncbi:ABC transporter ATP-binding protein [Glycomyces paridis]|uniref:ABC transporter ATP-binding protein n=1 Tax=Glycomyces paridis TaxID=2126555 RepID=A0A4S8PHY3_9ACTN|nr:ABC transporter ATP-binding protein [Glycomyces paridis]THV30218.1 ABC transporter ATP-binding protein [Glycomyces paridis]
MSAHAVRTEGLSMSYGDKQVLHGVDLAIPAGEIVALLGPNGAGKTTTMEILEGFRGRSAGSVSVLGEDPQTAGEAWRSRIGVVLQHWEDHANWRVGEFLRLLHDHYRPFGDAWDAEELLAAVGLESQRDTPIKVLSGGQRRRMDLAAGLIGRPELLFLDEPSNGLDPVSRRDFQELVAKLNRDLGVTILMTTHDLHEAERLADRIVVLIGGRVLAEGTVAALSEEMGERAEVRWTEDGRRRIERSADPLDLIDRVRARCGGTVADLEVRRSSLEDTYLAMVARALAGETLRADEEDEADPAPSEERR